MLCVARSLCFSLAECVLVKFCVNMRFMSVLFCVSTWLDCFHLPCAYVFVMFGVSTWLVIRFLVPCAFLSCLYSTHLVIRLYSRSICPTCPRYLPTSLFIIAVQCQIVVVCDLCFPESCLGIIFFFVLIKKAHHLCKIESSPLNHPFTPSP